MTNIEIKEALLKKYWRLADSGANVHIWVKGISFVYWFNEGELSIIKNFDITSVSKPTLETIEALVFGFTGEKK